MQATFPIQQLKFSACTAFVLPNCTLLNIIGLQNTSETCDVKNNKDYDVTAFSAHFID